MNKCKLCGANHTMPIEIPDDNGEYNGTGYNICDACWDIIAEVAHKRLANDLKQIRGALDTLTSLIVDEREKRIDAVDYVNDRLTNHINNCHGEF